MTASIPSEEKYILKMRDRLPAANLARLNEPGHSRAYETGKKASSRLPQSAGSGNRRTTGCEELARTEHPPVGAARIHHVE
jgi:hypothetical protein